MDGSVLRPGFGPRARGDADGDGDRSNLRVKVLVSRIWLAPSLRIRVRGHLRTTIAFTRTFYPSIIRVAGYTFSEIDPS